MESNEKYVDVIEVFEGEDEQWYFRGRSANREVVLGGEAYTTKRDAVDAANKLGEQLRASVLVKGE
jgi:uncharacterized protein YegP (UPF0339 family)